MHVFEIIDWIAVSRNPVFIIGATFIYLDWIENWNSKMKIIMRYTSQSYQSITQKILISKQSKFVCQTLHIHISLQRPKIDVSQSSRAKTLRNNNYLLPPRSIDLSCWMENRKSFDSRGKQMIRYSVVQAASNKCQRNIEGSTIIIFQRLSPEPKEPIEQSVLFSVEQSEGWRTARQRTPQFAGFIE